MLGGLETTTAMPMGGSDAIPYEVPSLRGFICLVGHVLTDYERIPVRRRHKAHKLLGRHDLQVS